MAGGRPSIFTQELGDEICARIAEGKSFRSIARCDEMPSIRSMLRWIREKEEFRLQYAHAREAQADSLFEEAFDIADEATPETANVARLRVDLRKWASGKLSPKKYGERVTNSLVGPDDGPIQVVSDETRVRALAAFLAKTASKT